MLVFFLYREDFGVGNRDLFFSNIFFSRDIVVERFRDSYGWEIVILIRDIVFFE